MSTLPLLSLTPTGARRPLVFNWGVSSFYGWGIYGLNLLLTLADRPDYAPFVAMEIQPGEVVLDPLREARLAALAAESRDIWLTLGQTASPAVEIDAPLLLGLGKDLMGAASAQQKELIGQPSIGVAFLEEASLNREARRRADRLALIIAGSTWNERILRAHGIVATTTVLQGVDASLFHPAPRSGAIPHRFVVFSGGKLEFRKGQDLVLAAFRAFRQRHPEALLLTAWSSPWSELTEGAAAHPGISAPRVGPDGIPDVLGWAAENGIPADAVIALGRVPNIAMPHVIREADVALFPNRSEGGTNLVAMECMACGIPTILSANTGHLDLLDLGDVALRLDRQDRVVRDGVDTTDWGESDVEEMLERLETVWRDRAAAAELGLRAAQAMEKLSWRSQIALLLRAIEPVLP
jgi:glycosyltransferase involved in cell wall biosynthesis